MIEIVSENFIQHFQQLDYEKILMKMRNSVQEDNKYRKWYTGKSRVPGER